MKKILSFLLMSLLVSTGFAASQFKVDLISIKQVKQSENKGDELYMAITEYPKKGRPRHYYFPKQPLHWPSQHIEKIKPTEIWQHALEKDDAVTVIFALVERDVPPWNNDDLIGEVQLKLSNKNGKLQKEWSVLTRGAQGNLKQESQTVTASLQGQGGSYDLKLKLQK